jgi:hypothetical protein
MNNCESNGLSGDKPFRIHVFGAMVSLICSIFVAISLCPTPQIASENIISTNKQFIVWTNLCNVAFSFIAVVASADVYYYQNSGHDRVHMSLMLGWIFAAILTLAWTLALYNNIIYMLYLPRMKGDINLLLIKSKLKMESHMRSAIRVAVVLLLTFLGTTLIFLLFTNKGRRESEFPNLFVGFVCIYLILDAILLVFLLMVARSVRTLASMPLLANRVLICIVIGVVSFSWLCVVFFQALRYGATNSLTKDSTCFYYWFNKVHIVTNILSYMFNVHIFPVNISPQI